MIGFNKCGTRTLHSFFKGNRIRSAHWECETRPDKRTTRIAKQMSDNISSGQPVLTGMTHYQAFSDLITLTETEIIEANSFFREMHHDHPDAFFIFNDRPMEDWIKSRLNHELGRLGSFVGRYAKVCNINEDAVPDLWRTQYTDHKRAVLDHFQGHSRFLHFDITQDGPESLRSFFGDTVPVNTSRWRMKGSTEEVARRKGVS